jgi:hypothetical protein
MHNTTAHILVEAQKMEVAVTANNTILDDPKSNMCSYTVKRYVYQQK